MGRKALLTLPWAFLLVLSLLTAPITVEAGHLDEPSTTWAAVYGGVSNGGTDGATISQVEAVAIAPNGDIVIAGNTFGFGAGGSDFWVLRLNGNGKPEWGRSYGGKKDDYANAVSLTPGGDIIVAGGTYSFGAGGKDVWVLRLSGRGSVEWEKTYGETHDDTASGVAVAPNGDIVIAGQTYAIGSGTEAWVLRLGKNGGSEVENRHFKCAVETGAQVSSANVAVMESNAQAFNGVILTGTPGIETASSSAKTVYLPFCKPTTVTRPGTTTSSTSSTATSITTVPIHLPSVSSPESSTTSSGAPPRTTKSGGHGICGPALVAGLMVIPLVLRRRRR